MMPVVYLCSALLQVPLSLLPGWVWVWGFIGVLSGSLLAGSEHRGPKNIANPPIPVFMTL